ncbi:hypothetical protein GIB67_011272 [Kingdonia uniflora]|uniref:Uncharacterized protein n=1 Tax=Kingdonia uniflora TaxID=39325 RepID=A0A7J7NAR5_9MAGN|nr:hypothetical protein GIB67_011272 [Kingdonia uniflora]
MEVTKVAKIDIVFFNQEEVVGEAYHVTYHLFAIDFSFSSFVLPYLVSLLSFVSKESKKVVEQNKEEVVEDKDDDDGNSQNKPDPEQLIKEMAVDQTNLVLMESEVDVILKKMH